MGLSLSSKGKGLVADLLGRQVSLQVSARMGGGFNRSLVGVDPRVKRGRCLLELKPPSCVRRTIKKGARFALNNNSRGLLFTGQMFNRNYGAVRAGSRLMGGRRRFISGCWVTRGLDKRG